MLSIILHCLRTFRWCTINRGWHFKFRVWSGERLYVNHVFDSHPFESVNRHAFVRFFSLCDFNDEKSLQVYKAEHWSSSLFMWIGWELVNRSFFVIYSRAYIKNLCIRPSTTNQTSLSDTWQAFAPRNSIIWFTMDLKWKN